MYKIGDAQFRVMCEMFGVDSAIKAAKRMGMKATDEQIAAAREKEVAMHERWDSAFKGKEG